MKRQALMETAHGRSEVWPVNVCGTVGFLALNFSKPSGEMRTAVSIIINKLRAAACSWVGGTGPECKGSIGELVLFCTRRNGCGAGLGRRALLALLTEIRDAHPKCVSIVLNADVDASAHTFWAKMGFVRRRHRFADDHLYHTVPMSAKLADLLQKHSI